MDASVSKKASKTPALLKRSKRFHTLFQWPKRSGRARQRTFSTVKKCSASRKRRSSSAFLPRRGRQARNTASVCAQSSSSIFVDIGPGPVIRSESYESCPIPQGNLEGYVSSPARRLMRHGGRPHISRIERRRGPTAMGKACEPCWRRRHGWRPGKASAVDCRTRGRQSSLSWTGWTTAGRRLSEPNETGKAR